MKKVVLLAPYFLPRRRVGAWRPFKFAIHLRDFGWQPHVITIEASKGRFTPKEKALLQGIPIHKIAPPFDFTSRSGSQLSGNHTTSKSSRKSFQPLIDWIDKQFPVDTWLPLFLLRKRRIFELINRIDPNVIWSTGDPWSSHWLGKSISQRLDLPWVADFRDPWTLGDINLKKRSSFSSFFDKKAERSVLKNAERVIFTSTATEQLYKVHYPNYAPKMCTIYNAFDEDLYSQPEANIDPFDSDQLNLLFFGKFRRLSPAKPLIDTLAKLKREDAETARHITIHSFGPLNKADREHAKQQGVFDQFNRWQPIPAEQMLSVLPNADVLWLSTAAKRGNIIPAKLWDYLAARRPIISIAPNPEIGRILEQTGAGIQLPVGGEERLLHLLQQCVQAKKQGKKLPIPFATNKEAVSHFEAKSATRTLAQTFDQLI